MANENGIEVKKEINAELAEKKKQEGNAAFQQQKYLKVLLRTLCCCSFSLTVPCLPSGARLVH